MTRQASPYQGSSSPEWQFTLYTAGANEIAQKAENVLRRLCEHYVPGRYNITIVDILAKPAPPIPADLLAIPAVVRNSPAPERRVIGDLSEAAKAANGLGLTDELPLEPI
ncbi:MAG: hypothetical protein KQH53_18720 [Desulfarculaceae bacterium]|nr:hypothetical protein [Desulfarculaceae bacterium]